MKTAVEWLVEQMKTYNMTVSVHNTSHQNVMDFYKAIEKAKEMEKSHIEQSFNHGRNVGRDGSPGVDGSYYYKKTFKEE